jgi:hypothetical protein
MNICAEITLILFLKVDEECDERYENISFCVTTHLSKIKLRNNLGLFPWSLLPHSKNLPDFVWWVFVYPVLKVELCIIPLTSCWEAVLWYLIRQRNGFQSLLLCLLPDWPIFYSDCPNGSKKCILGYVCFFQFFLCPSLAWLYFLKQNWSDESNKICTECCTVDRGVSCHSETACLLACVTIWSNTNFKIWG